VTVIVPFAAGGTADIFARMVSNHLQVKLGKPFVVENVRRCRLDPRRDAAGEIGA
jgi:tripartite-type tricarboxylate transporter receptor subunit TctC